MNHVSFDVPFGSPRLLVRDLHGARRGCGFLDSRARCGQLVQLLDPEGWASRIEQRHGRMGAEAADFGGPISTASSSADKLDLEAALGGGIEAGLHGADRRAAADLPL